MPLAHALPQLPQSLALTSRQAPAQQSWAPPGLPTTQGNTRPTLRQAAEEPQRQPPPTQRSATVVSQTLPQPPQLARSDAVSTHRPEQHDSPAAQHVAPQTVAPAGQQRNVEPLERHTSPSAQAAVPHRQAPITHRSFSPQACPQPPQWSVLDVMFVHAPSQQASPAAQIEPPHEQPPMMHDSPGPHAVPHAPQCRVSLITSTQLVPQHVSPSPHGGEHSTRTQIPSAHVSSAAQACPHEPQLAGSVVVSTQAVPQQVRPASQPPQGSGMQIPVRHTWPAGQAAPQAPQFVALSCRFAHPAPGQHVVPAAQAAAPSQVQAPAVHPLADGAPQTFPHAPQFAGSVCGSMQIAPHRSRPAGQVPDEPSSSVEVVAQAASRNSPAGQPARSSVQHLPARRIDTSIRSRRERLDWNGIRGSSGVQGRALARLDPGAGMVWTPETCTAAPG